jgi:hypothetical protein
MPANKKPALHFVDESYGLRQDDAPIKTTVAYFRNPLSRLASVYQRFIARDFRLDFGRIGMWEGAPFHRFCDAVINGPLDDWHLRPQSSSIRVEGDAWFARMENLSEKWPMMVDTFNLDCIRIPPHFQKQDYDWLSMYTPELEDAVASRYKEDMELWLDLQ